MQAGQSVSTSSVLAYLHGRPRWIRWREWVRGRRYRLTHFEEIGRPLVVVAHAARDAVMAREVTSVIEETWPQMPSRCRQAYYEILSKAPGIVVVQLRRKNVCRCLGHRHIVVKEEPFAEVHEALGRATCGEMDIAYQQIENWLALPLTDIAFDTKFLEGSRLQEFHLQQLRIRLLSVVLHETHHLVHPQDPETSVRERSLAFYREGLAGYVENAMATLSLTIDRSFSRLG